MDNKHTLTLLHLLLLLLSLSGESQPAVAAATSSILSYGAIPDGTTDSTDSLLSAWSAACASSNPSQVHVPNGKFLLNSKLRLSGPCNNSDITVYVDGTLIASSDYEENGTGNNAGNWVLFDRVDGVTILGGTLDGRGFALWDCKRSGESCPAGATTLRIWNSRNVEIVGLKSLNSQLFHIVIVRCDNVKLRQVTVLASENSPNTDGIHVQQSQGVTILNSEISSGDDCISIGPGTKNLWIENVGCGPGHGISIGSLGKDYEEEGVENVMVKSVRFHDTDNGLRIKTWARPTTGFVRGVVFKHAVMNNVRNPIVIDQNYCPYNKNCPTQDSGVRISDVIYEDIQGSSATEVAVKFDCSSTSPCEGIRLEDVNLSYNIHGARAACYNAAGTAAGLIQPASCLY